ncbi:MAG: DUF4150 domain-containing protein, partial [Thermoplasmata archaeon]|nr:DUF4150 domain-containing protein [Thermoplasmata archaeon]NIS12186.1 DUF4150 domain-containing protein [Thermoplasmata archaeon]NIS20103.1 DUF4150 domain-containing protein [Thermoplasmata archaeon]NIT77426.1 DUF4150 domain-containing protein [Thermoplasmata archaeon]NIU49205.1 DUF4150 domain-containing protein [Thermoplasmata archaeon]
MGQQLGQQVVGPADEPTEVAFPDVCETPEPAPEVPVPYPETGRASDQTSRPTKVEGGVASMPGAAFTPSEGDEPGTGGPGKGTGRLPGGTNPLLMM